MDRKRGIGQGGVLPWHLPIDLRRFRAITVGKTILMGRRTYESIGRALPDRRNIILSRDPEFRAIGCETYTSYQCVLQSISKEIEVMVIGGASIYSQFLPVADRLFLTSVDTISGADVFFPKIDYSTWQQVDSEYVPADSKNIHDCTFEVFKKRK